MKHSHPITLIDAANAIDAVEKRMNKKETLAKVLCDRYVFASFAEAKRSAWKGHIKVNGKPINNVMTEVKTGDHIEVFNKWSKTVELKD